MDNQRLILFIALSLVVLMLYNAWQEQFHPPQTPPAAVSQPAPAPAVPQGVPSMPAAPPAKEVPAGPPTGATQAAIASHQRVHVKTDLLDVEIDTTGGDIRRVALLDYPLHLDTPDQPVLLLDDRLPHLFVAQSGLLSGNGPSVDHHAVFTSEKSDYTLAAGNNDLKVALHWQGDNGFSVTRTYTFHRNSYVIDMNVAVNNATAKDWTGRLYTQLQRTDFTDTDKSRFINTFMGGVASTPANKYQKIKFSDMTEWKPEESFSKGGWVAMVQHYFLGAWIPPESELNHFYTSEVDGGRYIIGMQTADTKVAAGQTGQFSDKLFVGPKIQKRLDAAAPNLRLTVDYGVLTVLAEPIFWLMSKIHGWVNNWGWAIIFVTLTVKVLFFKLSEASYRSMANMRKFQPKLQALKERYGDDKQRMSQAMMEIYKKEKINPLGGCLPMIVQIPVFIALYWVLLESVELRQASFMLWIHDLSSKDPYYVLPLIMGASMLIQQRLNPAPMDPMQKRMMQMLPIVFTLFFAFFPAGLVLYWVVNNVLSILQQWYITRKIEAQASSSNK
jgi:YidC/Oxa1 family membrane protein insertase